MTRAIRRPHRVAPVQNAPLVDADLAEVVTREVTAAPRGRAPFTLEWMGAFRRAEPAALWVEDVVRARKRLVARLPSKRDQEGRGTEKGIPRASDAAPRHRRG